MVHGKLLANLLMKISWPDVLFAQGMVAGGRLVSVPIERVQVRRTLLGQRFSIRSVS